MQYEINSLLLQPKISNNLKLNDEQLRDGIHFNSRFV